MNRRVTLGVCTSWLACLTLSLLAILSLPTIAAAQLPGAGRRATSAAWRRRAMRAGGDGGFYVRGGGADIWGTADGFHFAYRSLTGDGEIVTRVNTVDYLDAWSKAGVMMRESLVRGPSTRSCWSAPERGSRSSVARPPAATASSFGLRWRARLLRSSSRAPATTSMRYQSTDGATWTWVGSEWIDMPATIYVGLAVTSHYYGATQRRGSSAIPSSEGGRGDQRDPSGSLPSGWASGDIGAVAASGWAARKRQTTSALAVRAPTSGAAAMSSASPTAR